MLQRFSTARAVVTDYDAEVLGPLRAFVTRRVRAERVTFARADAKRLPFPDGSFDVVLTLFALHHVMGYIPAIREAARVLRPRGAFLVAEPLRSRFTPRFRRHAPPEGLPTARELRSLIEAEGFRVALARDPGLGVHPRAAFPRRPVTRRVRTRASPHASRRPPRRAAPRDAPLRLVRAGSLCDRP